MVAGRLDPPRWRGPTRPLLRAETGDADRLTYGVAADVLGEIRKAKTSRQRSLRTEVDRAVVRDTA